MTSYLELRKTEGEYYFSYDKIRLQLNKMRSHLDYEAFENETPLNILARDLGDANFIGDLSAVEWRAFGITRENLKRFIIEINNREEGVRVLTYLRGHGKDVLPLEAPLEEIEEFEKHCAYLINKEIQKSKNDVLTDEQKLETRPSLWDISLEKPIAEDPRYGVENKIIFKYMWKQKDYQYTNCYPYQGICYTAQLLMQFVQMRYNVLVEHGVGHESYRMIMNSTEVFLKLIKNKVSYYSKRYVLNAKEPIIQTIFVASAYLLAFCKEDSTQEAAFRVTTDEMMGLVKALYKINIQKDVLAAVEELKQYKKINNIVYWQEEIKAPSAPSKDEKYVEDSNLKTNRVLRVKKLKEVYQALIKAMDKEFTGCSQWFYVYKLMVENGIYINRKYKSFVSDLIDAGISKEMLPDTTTFTRKYKQIRPGCTYPWETKSGGRSDILDEGNKIAEIAKPILGF